MANQDDTARQDAYNEAQCAVERCQALGGAIQHESEDGDEHATLFTLLDRELISINKFLEASGDLFGYKRRPAEVPAQPEAAPSNRRRATLPRRSTSRSSAG